jgi:YidC/Oxa1 family membrane protein insertase
LDIKRLLIATLISAAILILWPKIFPPPKPGTAPAGTSQAATAKKSPGPVATAIAAAAALATPTPAAAAASPVKTDPVRAEVETHIIVSNSHFEARLSNRGGDLLAFRLKEYKDSKKASLDLVHHEPPFPRRELRLDPADPLQAKASGEFFRHEVKEIPEKKQAVVTFSFRDDSGQGLVRTYTFGSGFTFRTKLERMGQDSRPVTLVVGPGIGNPSKEEVQSYYTKPGGTIWMTTGAKIDRKAKDGLKEPLELGTGVAVAGIEDNYFLMSFLPPATASVTLRPAMLEKTVAGSEKKETLHESEVTVSALGSLDTEVFFGPLDIDVLETIRPGMDKLVDFGWFSILAKPLLLSLRWIYGWAANWGLAIIVITIIIKILLFPLTYKQLVSMKKMSVLQPKIETIRTKYASKVKSDPQARLKMNEEMMGLYKTENVNPASGCIPLVLQMPILFAFYQVLARSIELRQAPFWLWIQDLSTKDPYYVTPILMTITMWLQQQLTPQVGDATQKKILAVMPFVFGFMFKDMPSGLVLYWLVQNVLTIGQQLLLDRYTDLGPNKGAKRKKK